jgi:hypothetical protein
MGSVSCKCNDGNEKEKEINPIDNSIRNDKLSNT